MCLANEGPGDRFYPCLLTSLFGAWLSDKDRGGCRDGVIFWPLERIHVLHLFTLLFSGQFSTLGETG